MTRSGTRLDGLRRTLLGATILLLVAFGVGLTTSFFENRQLGLTIAHHREVLAKMSADTNNVPSLEVLQQLDLLRAVTDSLGQWVRGGAPLRYTMGLFVGDTLYPATRTLYFEEFRKHLFVAAKGALVDSLKALPATATGSSDYGTAYGWLKGYIQVTSVPESSTV